MRRNKEGLGTCLDQNSEGASTRPGAGGGTFLFKSLSLGLQPNYASAMLYLRLLIVDNPQIVAA